MPPRKVSKRVQPNRVPTQFGQLDTTPTSRDFQSSAKFFDGQQSNRKANLPTPLLSSAVNPQRLPQTAPSLSEDFADDIDDIDLVKFGESQDNLGNLEHRAEGGPWSEVGSQTRRSSPLLAGDTPHHIWQFDEDSISPFSDARSSRLPDTMPLPPDPTLETQIELPFEAQHRVDFSETATTIRRSSPISCRDTPRQSLWDFRDEAPLDFMRTAPPDIESAPKQGAMPPKSPESHLPMDEMYDATPVKESQDHKNLREIQDSQLDAENDPFAQDSDEMEVIQPVKRPKRTMGEMLKSELASEVEDNLAPEHGNLNRVLEPVSMPKNVSQTPNLNSKPPNAPAPQKQPLNDSKGKKRKQRAKAPLPFDETTHCFKDVPREEKPTPPVRMPIVKALIDSAERSNSPVTSTRKRGAPKTTQPKKKRKVMPRKEERKEPPRPPAKRAAVEDPGPKTASKNDGPTTRSKDAINKVEKPKEARIQHEDAKDRDQPVSVSSDTDGSSFQPDSSWSPEKPGTADTTIEHHPRGSKKATPSRAVRNDISLENAFKNGDYPEASSHNDAPSEEQPLVDPESSQKPVQRGKKSQPGDSMSRNREKEVVQEVHGLGSQGVLIDRSQNIQTKPASGKKGAKNAESRVDTSQKQMIQTQQAPRGGKVPRTLSISVVGSPLLVNDDLSASPVQSQDHDSGSSGQEDDSTSRKLDFGLFDSHKARKPTIAKKLETTIPDRESLATACADIEKPEVAKPFSAYTKEPQGRQPAVQSLPSQFTNMNKDLHRQILAALQLQDAEFQQSDETQKEVSDARVRDAVVTNENNRGHDNEAAEQLHGIVDTLTAHLISREEITHNVVDVYQKKCLSSVEKITTRFNQEQQQLQDGSKKDGDRFIKRLNTARSSIQKGEQRRQQTARQIADDLATRRKLYRKATMNLRAVYQRLLGETG